LKTGPDAKAPSKKAEDQSVKTGRTMKQIAEARDAEWETNREAKDASATSKFKARIRAALKKKEDETDSAIRRDRSEPDGQRVRRRTTSGKVPGQLGEPSLPNDALPDLPSAKPRFIEPMKAKLVEKPPATGGWIYELKFDGFRAVAVKISNRVSLYSRNEKKLDARFPEIVDAIKQIPAGECVIDGEIVAVDEEGRSSFQLLQAREMEAKKSPLYFYAFDLPQLEGKNLMSLPLEARKNALELLCAGTSELIRFSGAIGSDAGPLLKEVKKRGLEGLIGKLRNSVYEPGRGTGAWIKLKCVSEQEFVIGGYTPPQGSRKHFGAILVGYYKDKTLVFAGKVGTGFTAKSLSMLHKKFQNERRDDCPFVDLPSKSGGQWSQGITPSMMKKMHWLDPVFVCQIKFAEWTRDKKLRAPVFLGLREDKKPSDVIRDG
jgi:bifunctional non-homologous end joining protein LigD